MKIPLVLPLFLSSTDHSYNVALRLFDPPAMFGNDIVPALPTNAVTETNRETLTRLRHDLACVNKQLLSAADEYRMYVDDGHNQPTWGYCVESASVEGPRDILVLMRVMEGRAHSVTLRWLSMSKVHTRKNAHLLFRVVSTYHSSPETYFLSTVWVMSEVSNDRVLCQNFSGITCWLVGPL